MEGYSGALALRMVVKCWTIVFVIVAKGDLTGVKKLAENESFQ